MIQVSAPAKIILLGEHAVVYGQPAIAIPVSRLRATATARTTGVGTGLQVVASDSGVVSNVKSRENLEENPLGYPALLALRHLGLPSADLQITVNSDIPLASGLGSGAAIATVIMRSLSLALNTPLADKDLNNLVYEVEKLHHGNPSGIDNTVIVYERPVFFVRGQPIEFLTVNGLFRFLIADTGISAPTRLAIADVKRLYEDQPSYFQAIFHNIGVLVDQARDAIQRGDQLKVGALMSENHRCLQELTVSSPELDRLVQAAINAGAHGAKLSGGGRGGNMIALVSADNSLRVQRALIKAGATRVVETILGSME
jgi:mevalonate kinase